MYRGRRAVEAFLVRTANRLPLFAVLRLYARLARLTASLLLDAAEAEPYLCYDVVSAQIFRGLKLSAQEKSG
jgi:hypothetical protein